MNRSFKTVLKRIGAIVLSACLFIVAGSGEGRVFDAFTAKATASVDIASGSWTNSANDLMYWNLSSAGVLTVSGNGPMDIQDHPGIMKVNITDDLPWYGYKDSINEVVIMPGVTEIGDRAFEGKAYTNKPSESSFDAFMGITKVSCANNTDLKRIGKAAFQNCQNLVEVDLSGCTNLETIDGKDSPTWWAKVLDDYSQIGIEGYMEEGAFSDCISLISVNITGCTKIKKIGAGAFHNGKTANTFLASFDYSVLENLEVICVAAFKDNSSKNAIDFSAMNNLVTIDAMAFRTNTGVVNVNLSGKTRLEKIGDQAFYQQGTATIKVVDLSGCTALKEIGTMAFANNGSGAIVSVDLTGCTSLKTIGAKAFERQQSLKSIVIPSGVTSIADDAFNLCKNLKSVTWDAASYGTDDFAIKDLISNVNNIRIGENVTTLPNNFFDGLNLSDPQTAISFAPRSSSKTITMKFPYGTNTTNNNQVLTYTVDENGHLKYGDDVVFPSSTNRPEVRVLPTAKNLSYTGSNQELIVAGQASDGCTMQYKVGSGKFKDSIPTGIDAGTYTITYRAVNGSITSSEGTLTVVINRIQNPAAVDTNPARNVGANYVIDFSNRVSYPENWFTTNIEYSISNSDGGIIDATTGIYNAGEAPIPGRYYITIRFIANRQYTETTYRIPLEVSLGDVCITIDPDDGVSEPTHTTIAAGGKAECPDTNPTKKGYSFKHWYLAIINNTDVSSSNKGTAYDFDNPVTSSITLKAAWDPIKYKIVYYENGGSGSMSATNNVKYDSEVALRQNTFSKAGEVFLGWSLAENGPVEYLDKQKVKNLTSINGETVTLYAVWASLSVSGYNGQYDGAPHSVEVTFSGTCSNENVVYDYSTNGGADWSSDVPSVTNVSDGEKSVLVRATVGNNSITSAEPVTLKVTARPVTITARNESGAYNGSALTQPEFDCVGLATGDTHTFTVVMTAESAITYVGDKPNVIASVDGVPITTGTATEVGNYLVTTVDGTLTVSNNNNAIVINSVSKIWKYDDDSHKNDVYTVKYDGTEVSANLGSDGKVFTLPTGDTVTITSTATGVKDYDAKYSENNTYTYIITNAQYYNNVTANFGTLSIEKRTVTLTSESAEKPYDGTSLTKPSVTVGGDGFVAGDVSEIKATGSVTTVAEGEVTNTIVFTEGASFKADNYSITKNEGTLKITKCPVTIKADDKTKEYDNDATTDSELTATVTGVPENGVAPVYTLSRAEGQDVKDYAISVNADAAANPNYTITVEAGTFTISQKEAVLAWSETEFPYDGKSHLPVATVSNLADGDTCEVTIDGAQAEIGDAYTANATALSNPNYKLPADASTKFKIYGCTITFVDEDGTELQSGVVEYGTTPSYTGKTPVKAATAQYSYEFLDWSPTITEVTGDKTYTATYKPILNTYTVTWKDEDGTVLETDKDVPYGTVPTYDGKEPVKAATAEYSFKFDGWSIKVAEVTGDITYTATYAKTAIEYTVEAENLPEGTQLSFSGKETVEAGKVLTFKVLLADGYEATDDLVVTVNGTKIAPNADGSYTIPSVMTNSVISVTGVVKVDYNLTEGENAEYKQGDSKNARFVFKRTVNDKITFGRFTYAELDGKLLDPNNYTKVSGSLILELKKEFLDTLPVGEHLLKVYFSDDKEGVIAHFLISAGITPTVTVTVTPAPDSNPTTGDTSNPILWVLLIGAAVLGLIGVIYSRSRQEM